MKSEDGPSAGQSSPRPSLPDTSKELLRKLAEELLLLHGQAEAAEARATAAEARATAAEAEAATLQQRLDGVQAAGDQAEGGAAPDVQQLLADAKRRARLAEADAAAAQSEAASLRVQLTDTQQQLAAARQEAAAARQRAAEAEEQLVEARRQAEAERLQARRAAEEAAAVEQQLQESRRQLEERASGASAPLEKPLPSPPRQQPEEVLTLRPKLEEERRLRRKAERELEVERRQRQAAEALARSLQGQAAERSDGAAQQQGLPAQAAAALAPEGTAAPSVEQHELDEDQHEEQLSLAATEPQVDIDLAAEDEGAADMEQQRRQGSGGSTQHPGTSGEGDQAGRWHSGGAAGEPAAAALGAAARQRQPAGDEGMRPPPQRLARLRGPMRPAGSGPTQPAAESPAGPSSGGTAPHHHKRKAERAAGDAAAPASASPLTVTTRRHSSGGTLTKRHRGVVEPSPSSPGDSALDVAAVLQRQLRSNSAAAAAATTPAGPHGATALLAAAEQEGEEEGEEEGANGAGGRGRRSGRRSAAGLAYTERGVSGGGVVLKPGESAKAWLNRSIAAYVASLATSRDFEPFRRPVDVAQVPDYLDVVQQPMDLGTIKAKATEGRYRSPREFQSDLQLVVSNAQEYNESPRHPVHQAATLLMDTLQKPHSFYSKVADQFRQAETTATLAEEKARQEAEIEALERRLAAQVRPGLNLAVYAEDDNEKNKYFLMQATKPTLTLTRTEVDDFGNEFKRGDKVVVGHYYDYWTDARGKWDRSRRPYYLQDDRTAYVPASSLLLVDFELHACEEPELSPYSGREERIYEMGSDLHKELRKQIKKMTAEPAVLPGSP